jgi:hypothetical protein
MYLGSTGEIILHDGNRHLWASPVVEGETKRHGGVPRPYETHPVGCYATIQPFHAVDMPLIPQSEWSQRLRDQTAIGARLSDFRNRGMKGQPIPSRDQNGKGYCWAHSGVSAHLLVRARDNQPYADLSAYAIACVIKQYRDEGGWGAQGIDFEAQRGVPTAQFWAQRSMSRSNDNPQTWENAALHRISEGWIDLQAAQYDRNLSWAQCVTCWLLCDPVICDFNWWSHSVCGADLVEGTSVFPEMRSDSGKSATLQEFEAVWDMSHPVTGGFGNRIWNSWGDSWSQNGMGVLTPAKAVPDGSVALRVVSGSAA